MRPLFVDFDDFQNILTTMQNLSDCLSGIIAFLEDFIIFLIIIQGLDQISEL